MEIRDLILRAIKSNWPDAKTHGDIYPSIDDGCEGEPYKFCWMDYSRHCDYICLKDFFPFRVVPIQEVMGPMREVIETNLNASAVKAGYGVVPGEEAALKQMLEYVSLIIKHCEKILAIDIAGELFPYPALSKKIKRTLISSATAEEVSGLYRPCKEIEKFLEMEVIYVQEDNLLWATRKIPYLGGLGVVPMGTPIPKMKFAYKDGVFVGVPEPALKRAIESGTATTLVQLTSSVAQIGRAGK